jgi:4-hydroxybenzoate polyprenyltransferase
VSGTPFSFVVGGTVLPVTGTSPWNLIRIFDIAGYLAVWPAFYLWSVAMMFADLAGLPRPGVATSIFLMALAMSVYLIDRVKLADRFLDPADADTHPGRHAWLWKHRAVARASALATGLVSGFAGFTLHPALAGAPLVGQIAVFAYSGLPPGTRNHFARLKDIPLVKNLAASLGLTTIAVLAVHHMGEPAFALDDFSPASVIAILVFADCLLCDVGDAPGDGRHGTRTIPVLFGTGVGRAIASIMVLGAGGWAWRLNPDTGWAWALAIVVSQVVLVCLPGSLIRNGTDLRLPILAGVVMLAL